MGSSLSLALSLSISLSLYLSLSLSLSNLCVNFLAHTSTGDVRAHFAHTNTHSHKHTHLRATSVTRVVHATRCACVYGVRVYIVHVCVCGVRVYTCSVYEEAQRMASESLGRDGANAVEV